jgi:exonuclease SbcD
MKIIHTADWHLGKIIYSNYMTQDQEYILNQFIEYLKNNQTDVLIISGDIYDRAVPPSEAVDLLNKTLSKIVIDMKIKTLIISGNHDSSERLEFLNGILSGMNLHIEGKIKNETKKITYNDEYGNVNFYLLPYVEMQRIKDITQIDFESKTDAIKHIIEKMNINKTERNILIAHEYVLGGETSDSERPLNIGGTEYVESHIFNDFDYVALGHLHRQQKIKSEKINYSGSLLKYSFSESNHIKGMNLITLQEKDNMNIEKISFSPKKDMKIIKDTFENLMQKESTDDYLQIILEDDKPIYDAINKLRSKYPNVLSMDFPNLKTNENIQTLNEDLSKIKSIDLFYKFYKEIKGNEIKENEKEIVEKVFNDIITQRGDI